MIVGCPKEIKNHEYRVGLTPAVVRELANNNHEILIETNSGSGSGFDDHSYQEAGARIVQTASEVFKHSELIIKVKEPQEIERKMLTNKQVLFTYLHLAPDYQQTRDLLESKVTAIAYETVSDTKGGLPLLAPMSEVAGRLAPQVGAWALQKANGGSGVLLGGVPGVIPASVLVIGGGVVGTEAALVASGMGANVTVMDSSLVRLKYLDELYKGKFDTCYASVQNTEHFIKNSDLIIGAVLVPGATAPKLVTKRNLSTLKAGSVIVDVAIDQGGCFETSRPTTHDNPIYEVERIIHYCVANMPGAVSRTSTLALSNATMPFILSLANNGWVDACLSDQHLLNGVNIFNGNITNTEVGKAMNLETKELVKLLK
jgi:alanine dehydrogenase